MNGWVNNQHTDMTTINGGEELTFRTPITSDLINKIVLEIMYQYARLTGQPIGIEEE